MGTTRREFIRGGGSLVIYFSLPITAFAQYTSPNPGQTERPRGNEFVDTWVRIEAGGQVFIIAEAETLSGEAANTLLKILEEPPESAPRNFFLLCPSPDVLLATLRSRSMSVYLGSQAMPDEDDVVALAEGVGQAIDSWLDTGSNAWLLGLAAILLSVSKWDEPRVFAPWMLTSSALVSALKASDWPRPVGRGVLELADDLLHKAPAMRRRSIPAQRILEGLVARRLGVVADHNPELVSAAG